MKDYADMIRSVSKAMDKTVKQLGTESHFWGMKPSELFVMDLMTYAMHLTAADGKIQREETEQMADLFGIEYTPMDIRQYMEHQKVRFAEYQNHVPISVKEAVIMDNLLKEQGRISPLEKSFADMIYESFEGVGDSVIMADWVEHGNERQAKEAFLGRLKAYIEENRK